MEDNTEHNELPLLPHTADEVVENFNANLQEEIDRYKNDMAALQAEFNEATDETSPLATKKALIAAAPAAIQTIISLITHGSSDGVQLNASKYVLDVALGKGKLESDSDGFDNLIEKLMESKTQDAADIAKGTSKRKDK